MPVLGTLVFVEISWSLPIDQDQLLRPEDVELADICAVGTFL